MRKTIRLLLCLLLCALLPLSACADTLIISPDQVLHPVSETLYGIFLEDINCAVDGGLYAELLKNRSFENESIVNPTRSEHWEAWTVLRDGGGAGIADEAPIHENNPHYLRVTLGAGDTVTILNQGFGGNVLRGGIPLTEGKRYDLSLFLRGDAAGATKGQVTVDLRSAAGESLTAQPVALRIDDADSAGTWMQVKSSLVATKTKGAQLSLAFSGEGTLDLDLVSLLPEDRLGAEWPGGGLRRDLVEALRELKPRFLRFPGGCVVEGSYVRSNAYDWKDSVGPLETRREIGNTWGGMQTLGVGFYEYFCLAEEIGALPLPVVHAGLLCQARSPSEAALTPEETKAYAQDILDLIAFALDGPETPWGALRAEMGHPAPFDLRYVAIGNENWSSAYFTRYGILRDAVKAAWPEITCIVAAGPVAEGSLIQDSWNQIRRSFAEDLVDEHYYMDSDWFPAHVNRYDSYPRTTHVFLGEYAAHEPLQGTRRPNNLHAALCEAAYLTGIERNSDIVDMCCYAPLLAREGEVDWTPDLIWFNDDKLCLTPSYWVQKLFSEAVGTALVKSECDGELYQAVTRTEKELQIKVVNLSEKEVPLTLTANDTKEGIPDGLSEGWLLSGDKGMANSLARPDKLVPEAFSCQWTDGRMETVLPPWSLLVLRVPLNGQ